MGEQRIDPKLERAMKFAQNFMRKHGNAPLSNLYVIQRKDRDGNVLEEKYGMNLVTDYGITTYFASMYNWFPQNLYVGQGGGGSASFDTTTNTLITPLSTVAATVTDAVNYHGLPMYYDRSTGLVTAVCQFLKCYLDYDFDGWYQDTSIYEYGIGTAYNQLWTHSWVYDNFGGLGMITKRPNERLEFTVYMCMSYSTNMINTEWNKGKCVVITMTYRFFANHMREANLQTFKRYSVYYNRASSSTQTAFDNVTKSLDVVSNITDFTLTTGNTADTGYLDGFRNISPGMVSFERSYMDPPCVVDTTMYPSPDYAEKPDGFSDTFGLANYLPFTQFTASKSYTFNAMTQAYDLEETDFVNSPVRWYNENSMEHDGCVKMYYSYHDTATPMYIYINMNTADPILKIGGNLLTVYATNEYWDKSKWVFINDLASIPDTCEILDGQGNPLNPRCMKYWITTSDTEDLKPTRASQKFSYVDSNNVNTIHHNFTSIPVGFFDGIGSKEYQWFLVDNMVYRLGANASTVQLSATKSNYDSIQSYTTGSSILSLISSSDSFIVTDVTAASPVPQTIQNTAGISNLWECYTTDSKNGRMVISDYTNSKLLKIDYRDPSNVVQTGINNCVIGCAIMMSTNYALIDSSNPKTILVKNFDTNVDITSFTVTGNNPTLIFGWRDLLYVTDCSTYLIVCNITSGTMTVCEAYPSNSNFGSYRHRLRTEASTDFMCLYRYDTANTEDCTRVFEYFRPTLCRSLGMNPGNYYNYQHIELRDLNRTVTGGTTVMVVTSRAWAQGYEYGNRQLALDLGSYMTSDKVNTTGIVDIRKVNRRRWVVYGDLIIFGQDAFPLKNVIPHRIVGTTNTVSTIDTLKNIREKRWTTTLSNISEWQGKPPGNQM